MFEYDSALSLPSSARNLRQRVFRPFNPETLSERRGCIGDSQLRISDQLYCLPASLNSFHCSAFTCRRTILAAPNSQSSWARYVFLPEAGDAVKMNVLAPASPSLAPSSFPPYGAIVSLKFVLQCDWDYWLFSAWRFLSVTVKSKALTVTALGTCWPAGTYLNRK